MCIRDRGTLVVPYCGWPAPWGERCAPQPPRLGRRCGRSHQPRRGRVEAAHLAEPRRAHLGADRALADQPSRGAAPGRRRTGCSPRG
eukprot:13773697-Alexandrium_andersonii.AAC.1